MAVRVPVQAARRSWSREARVSCNPAWDCSSVCSKAAECCSNAAAAASSACWLSPASLALACSCLACASVQAWVTPWAAVSRRAEAFSSRSAWALVWAVMSRAVWASVSLTSSWRRAAWVPACSHSWPSLAAMAVSVPVQAARRSWSREASAACSSACDWFSVCSRAAACCSKAAAAVSSACWLSPASLALRCSWRVCASVQDCVTLPAAASRRADTFSSKPAWAWVWAVMSRAVWASVSLTACWRATVSAPACCHCWPSVVAMAVSVPVQAARRS